MRGRHAIDLTGEKFKTWVVIGRDLEREETLKQAGKNKLAWYFCRCTICGEVRTFSSEAVRKERGAWCECQGRKKRTFNDRNERYGCLFCADKKKCSGRCKYRKIFEKYGSYVQYDAAAERDIMAVVADFPRNI